MDDFSTLIQSSGLVGAMTAVITQILKAITGWTDRRALVLAAIVAFVLALLAVMAKYGISPWVDYVRWTWETLQQWIGGVAAGTGIYKLTNRNSGNGG